MKTGLIIGSGRQSEAVVRFLSATNEYYLLILTRSTITKTAKRLAALPHVELITNVAQSGYDIPTFVAAAERSDFVFVNLDGFALGEMGDTYWGIRLFQLASRAHVKHFIYSGLDYIGKKTGFDPDFYVGHYEGKARVQEWMHAQVTVPMAWTIIRTGPYIENLTQLMAPIKDAEGTYVYNLPLQDGAIPFIHLDDLGGYVHWALAHKDRSNGVDLGVGTVHASGPEIAAALTATTGKPAKYANISTHAWNTKTWARLPRGPDTKIGFLSVKDEDALPLTYGENFQNWWHLYQASAGNMGLIRRDYQLLDEILPTRVRSLEEWMIKVGYTGERENALEILG